MPWEFISPFCGLSTYGQGFHVIESTVSDDGIKDMSSAALITITVREASATQIDNVFKVKSGPTTTWRWYVKRICDNKFQMIFPNFQTI
jgi:hypothetical protein